MLEIGGFTIVYKIPNNRFFRNSYFPISRLFMFIISSKAISSKVKEWEKKHHDTICSHEIIYIPSLSLYASERNTKRVYHYSDHKLLRLRLCYIWVVSELFKKIQFRFGFRFRFFLEPQISNVENDFITSDVQFLKTDDTSTDPQCTLTASVSVSSQFQWVLTPMSLTHWWHRCSMEHRHTD